ncbi:MAG: hypothetical protein V8R91_12160 [Butyricimonas faecihominis]
MNITDGPELLEFLLMSDVGSYVGTNHRWCDLRRYGLTVTHVLQPEGTDVFTGHETLCAAHPGRGVPLNKILIWSKTINV